MTGARARIDWRAIHDALDHRLSQIGGNIESDAERVQELLRRRTAQLAAQSTRSNTTGVLRVIVLRVGAEHYGLALEAAREVIVPSRIATVPDAGAELLGIMNWRGEFVAVFDLAAVLGVAPAEDQTRRRIVVLRREEPFMALAVDGIDRVVEVELSKLQPTEQLRPKHAELLRGAADGSLMLLDEDALLASFGEELQAA